jgi:hypothetical protein
MMGNIRQVQSQVIPVDRSVKSMPKPHGQSKKKCCASEDRISTGEKVREGIMVTSGGCMIIMTPIWLYAALKPSQQTSQQN